MNRTPVKFEAAAQLEVVVTVQLSENAALALSTLALFDEGSFLEKARASYGSAWGDKEAAGMTELFTVARDQVGPIIRRAEEARKVFAGKMTAKPLDGRS